MKTKNRWVVMLAGLGWLAGPATSFARIAVSPTPTKTEVTPGEIFTVPIFVQDARKNVFSYVLQVTYDPALVMIVDVKGGTFEGFSDTPLTDRRTFESGSTKIAANNESFIATPAYFNVVEILFKAVGPVGGRSEIRVQPARGTDVTVGRGFRRARNVARGSTFITIREASAVDGK